MMLQAGFLLLSLLGFQGPPSPDGAQEEIQELFRAIEKDLREIDRLLLEAGTGDSGRAKMEEASKKMEKLLQSALDGQKRVSTAIDEILKKIPPGG